MNMDILGEFTQSVFDQMIADHETWLDSGGSGGQRLNLVGRDLRGLKFHSRLDQASFVNCDMRYTQFDRTTKLSKCVFRASDFSFAHFSTNSCRESDFSECTLSRSIFAPGSYLSTCEFAGAAVDFTDFRGAKFQSCSFKNNSFRLTQFGEGTDLTGTKKETVFHNSQFDNCDLSGQDMRNVGLLDVQLEACNLSACDLRNISFSHGTSTTSKLRNVVFDFARLSGANFDGLDLTTVSFRFATMENFKIRNAKCSDVDFSQNSMPEADFSKSNMSRCTFSKSNLRKARFNSAFISGSDMQEATLDLADLTNADLSTANLLGATVNNTIFTNTVLRGATYVDGKTCNASSVGGCFFDP